MRILLSIFLLFTLVGCTAIPGGTNKDPAGTNKDNDIVKTESWQISPTFVLEAVTGDGKKITSTWQGQKGKVAITDHPFIASKPNKYMWLFWGNRQDLAGKKAEMVAVSKTGEIINLLSGDLDGGDFWGGAQGSMPSMLSLPSQGLWRIDISVDQKPFGTIVVDVQ